jgi:hypothetical protein
VGEEFGGDGAADEACGAGDEIFWQKASSDKSPTNIDPAALVDCKRLQWLGYADAEWQGVRSNRRVKCSALRAECRVD